ncbi:acyl-CoA dehydrogenase family protein [Cryptosporangium sp. NPDC048952]|uniref:acyl-CoA dehydrogenase family protein n=1 Tax=Cryptosporangium sp. NPDC048952 TaxID=3363961 RepID=UPI003722B66E
MNTSPFALSEREQTLLDTVTELAKNFAATAADYDQRAEIPVEHLRALTDAGVERSVLPADVGGDGVSYQAFGELIRVLAQADPSTATIFLMHAGAGIALAQLTAPTLGSYYADEFLGGARFANALSEPASGNTFLMPQQHAVAAEGGWTLDGAKRFVSGSEIAQHLLVNALVDGVPTFFGVEPDETVTTIPIWDTLGLRATRSQLLSFDATLLRADRRGRGLSPFDFAAIPAGLPAISLGIADAALGALVEHARGRIIQGEPLSHQQWVQFEVASAESGLEAAKAYFRTALWQADSGSPSTIGALSRAKLLANRVAVDMAQLGVRIGGASGYLKTSPIQRHLRDAEAGQLMAYSTEVLSGQIGAEILGA